MSGTERGVDDMIIEHYASFRAKLKSSALNQENWDILRTESTDMAYAIEDNIEQYERNCMEAKTYELSAEKIVELLSRYNCKHIVGLGSGKGILEWHIKRCMPQMYVECTDYARASMEKLEKVFTKCDGFHCFDMLHGDYTVFGQDVCFVLYRVSEEFSYEDWCRVFGKMRAEYHIYTGYAGHGRIGGEDGANTCQTYRKGEREYFLRMDIFGRYTGRNVCGRTV